MSGWFKLDGITVPCSYCSKETEVVGEKMVREVCSSNGGRGGENDKTLIRGGKVRGHGGTEVVGGKARKAGKVKPGLRISNFLYRVIVRGLVWNACAS